MEKSTTNNNVLVNLMLNKTVQATDVEANRNEFKEIYFEVI